MTIGGVGAAIVIGTRSPIVAGAARPPRRSILRQLWTALALTPCDIATFATEAPGPPHSTRIWRFSSALKRRLVGRFSLPNVSTYFLSGHDPCRQPRRIQDGIAARLPPKNFDYR
jgi:hypothetical protein